MKAKPGIVLLFNKTKGATDSYDHLISTCDVRRKSNRYQIAVLYDMINVLITDIFIIKRMENSDALDNRDDEINKLEEKEQKERKRNHSELKN